VVLIHNGIIENYLEIRDELLAKGIRPESETDSELFGYLVQDAMDQGQSLEQAARSAFAKVEGSSVFVLMSEKEPGRIVGLTRGLPLVAAVDPRGGAVLASDAQAFLDFTQDIVFMESGDGVVAEPSGLKFFDLASGRPVDRRATRINWTREQVDKRGYPHYFLKEIHEIPAAIIDTMNGVLDRTHVDPFTFQPQPGVEILKRATSLTLVACGTSYFSALLGKYWLEKWAKIPVFVELASEFRYRDPVIPEGMVVVGITQSGETADTLAVLQDMRSKKVPTLAITNTRGSSVSRTADATFFTSRSSGIAIP
jgi:glucosamine--fructose-6-phosphate aminotransferase (isomerizing)